MLTVSVAGKIVLTVKNEIQFQLDLSSSLQIKEICGVIRYKERERGGENDIF